MPSESDRPVEWETVEQLAKRLHVDVQTVRNWVKRNELPAHQVPGARRFLFDPAEVDRWIKEYEIRSRCFTTDAGDAA